nr:uncharacterized protein LOC109160503 [Ipomoea batatas]
MELVPGLTNTDKTKWKIALVYGGPNLALRRKLWDALNTIECNITTRWIAMGDFNAVMNSEEVSCPNSFNDKRNKDFNR